MKKVLLLFLLLFPAVCHADPVFKVFAGANGVWFDENAKPSDIEIGGNARASLSEHFSAVGGAYYGFDNSYLRGSLGARLTATDANDPNFSLGLGLGYQACSEPKLRPEEWVTDVSVGWRAWPEKLPKVILIAQGSYGLDQKDAMLVIGARYELQVNP